MFDTLHRNAANFDLYHINISNFRRPETSFLWLANPWKSFRFVIWRNYKWYIIGLIILVVILLFIGVFIYSAPVSLFQFYAGVGASFYLIHDASTQHVYLTEK